MYCSKHKRSLDGPAQIDMDAETRANVCTYVEDVRGVCADDSVEALFVTVEGKAFDESNIGKRVTAFWFKAKQIKLSSTDVRNIASSATFDMNVVEKRAVREHIAHKEETADHYYNIGHITKKVLQRSPATDEDSGFEYASGNKIKIRNQVGKFSKV